MEEKLRRLIKDKRKEEGLTQEQMAHLLNYRSKAAYNMLENGRTIITIEHIKSILKIFKITKQELISIFFDN